MSGSGSRNPYLSPLRYPGGKARLAEYIGRLIHHQRPRPIYYAEPFAGGAGAGLRLLVDEKVDLININDLDPGIAAFWRCVFDHTEDLVDFIMSTDVSLTAWHEHRDVYANPAGRGDLELGTATFFLNRCNRSGILTARPIGGLEQTGRWLIHARFNRPELAARVRFLADYRDRVRLSEQDAKTFITQIDDPERTLLYVDPPYISQGAALYMNQLSYSYHQELAEVLKDSPLQWFLTYDVDDRITDDLYENYRCASFNIKHTAQRRHIGSEYAVFSENLAVPHLKLLPREVAHWVAS